jgi:hypothetical protein
VQIKWYSAPCLATKKGLKSQEAQGVGDAPEKVFVRSGYKSFTTSEKIWESFYNNGALLQMCDDGGKSGENFTKNFAFSFF